MAMMQVTVMVMVQILSGSVDTGPNSILLVELELLLKGRKREQQFACVRMHK